MTSYTTVGAHWGMGGRLSYFILRSSAPAAARTAGVPLVLGAFARLALVIAFVIAIALLAAFFWRPDAPGFLALGFLKWHVKGLLFKNEAVQGTDIVPSEAANAFLAYDVSIKPLRLQTDRRDFAVPYFGYQGDLVAGKFVELEFKVPLAGSGAAGTAPGYGAALKACGLAETVNAGVSVVYAPATPLASADVTASIYFKLNGRQHRMTYGMGNAKLCLPAGKKPYIQFNFVALYNAPADVALGPLTLTAFQKELAVNNANTTPATLFTFAAKFRQVEVDLGNKVEYRNLPNSEAVRFLDRAAMARFTFESELVATKDYWSAITAETAGVLDITQGTVAGNKVQVQASNVQLLEPDLSDEGGASMETLSAGLKPSSAGNDEVSITVK